MQMQCSTRWICNVGKKIESQFWQFIWNSSREIKKQWSIDRNEFFKLCCSFPEWFLFSSSSFFKQNLPVWVSSLVLPVVWHCLGRHCHADSGGGYLPPRQNFQPPLSCLLCLPCFFLFHLFSKIGFDSGGSYLPPHQNVQPPFLSFLFAFNCVDHSIWLLAPQSGALTIGAYRDFQSNPTHTHTQSTYSFRAFKPFYSDQKQCK